MNELVIFGPLKS